MFDLTLTPGGLALYIFIAYLSAFLLLNLYYWFFFFRLAKYQAKPVIQGSMGISVVICARNEYFNLKENLPSLLEQDYSEFEVVVVNYSSDDESAVLLYNLSQQYSHLKSVEIRENLNFFSGKKFPLSIGIKSSRYDHIVVTEPNCRPASRKWLSHLSASFGDSNEVVLGYSRFTRNKGILNRLQRFESVQKAINYISFAMAGLPFMGVGRNLAYKKSLFYENRGFTSHYRLYSGDDDLFINKVATRSNTNVSLHPDSYVIAEPKPSFREWISEKKRHIFTPLYYRFGHQLLLAVYHFSTTLFYLSFLLLFFFQVNYIWILGVFILRMLIQSGIAFPVMKRLGEKGLAFNFPVFEPLFLILNLYTFITALFSKSNKWK